MPIYDYRCRGCGWVWEVFMHSMAHSPTGCPHCGSQSLERLFSVPYVIKGEAGIPGTTCCGRTERCQTPPCSTGDVCQRR